LATFEVIRLITLSAQNDGEDQVRGGAIDYVPFGDRARALAPGLQLNPGDNRTQQKGAASQ